jgi:hypothetical protein
MTQWKKIKRPQTQNKKCTMGKTETYFQINVFPVTWLFSGHKPEKTKKIYIRKIASLKIPLLQLLVRGKWIAIQPEGGGGSDWNIWMFKATTFPKKMALNHPLFKILHCFWSPGNISLIEHFQWISIDNLQQW